MTKKDYYEILNVSRTASEEEIKKSYRANSYAVPSGQKSGKQKSGRTI